MDLSFITRPNHDFDCADKYAASMVEHKVAGVFSRWGILRSRRHRLVMNYLEEHEPEVLALIAAGSLYRARLAVLWYMDDHDELPDSIRQRLDRWVEQIPTRSPVAV